MTLNVPQMYQLKFNFFSVVLNAVYSIINTKCLQQHRHKHTHTLSFEGMCKFRVRKIDFRKFSFLLYDYLPCCMELLNDVACKIVWVDIVAFNHCMCFIFAYAIGILRVAYIRNSDSELNFNGNPNLHTQQLLIFLNIFWIDFTQWHCISVYDIR